MGGKHFLFVYVPKGTSAAGGRGHHAPFHTQKPGRRWWSGSSTTSAGEAQRSPDPLRDSSQLDQDHC